MSEKTASKIKELRAVYLQPAFLICVAVLATSATVMSAAITRFGVHLEKTPLPLMKSLDLLQESSLAPYRVYFKAGAISEDVTKTLGTKDYIQWVLEDTQAAADSPVRYCSLFITYYELPDQVPHVPEECYMGGGYQSLASDSVQLKIANDDTFSSSSRQIPARYLVFTRPKSSHWRDSAKFSVLYFLRVNGTYCGSRLAARAVLGKNIRGKSSYFSKVEWKFFNQSFGRKVHPTKEQAVQASQRLMGVVLPVLEQQHWPQWNKADDEDKTVQNNASEK